MRHVIARLSPSRVRSAGNSSPESSGGERRNRRGRPCGPRSGVVSFPRQRTRTSHGDERFNEWPSPVAIDGNPLPRLRYERKWAFKEAN